MNPINRRDFMKFTSAGALAAPFIAPALAAAEVAPPAPLTAATVRTLGKTGLKCSLLGMGTGTEAWNGSSAQNRRGRDTFIGVLEHAHAKGVTYFDMADMYGAHDYMKEALKRSISRDKVMLLTKTVSREPGLLKADLERFRKELDTDCLDIVLLHCLEKPGWTESLKPCMDVLEEAKQKKIIRAHGCSNHNLDCLKEAAASPWVDVILARINPHGVKMDGKPEEVVPVLRQAHDNGKGILGMKIVGEGELKDRIPESVKFVLSLGCVDAIAVGFEVTSDVDGVIKHIEDAKVV
ncbi:MAG: aldo/keto reductase [Candidatus Hydrogenedentes bacterium]|nr:aldo/keto reductase [Candidatus Hydrogenedentota bacterium]